MSSVFTSKFSSFLTSSQGWWCFGYNLQVAVYPESKMSLEKILEFDGHTGCSSFSLSLEGPHPSPKFLQGDFELLSDSRNFTWDQNPDQFSHLALGNTSLVAEEDGGYPDMGDVKYWFLAALVLIMIRKLIEKHLFNPIGLYLGIKPKTTITPEKIPCRNTSSIPILEEFYQSQLKSVRSNPSSNSSGISEISKETKLDRREVERWLRRRRALDRPSKLTKFSESGWRFIVYVGSTALGIYALWDKEWNSDVKLMWENYPNHAITSEFRLYYAYGSAIYMSLLMTQAFDVKRKDFWEMLVHHVITLTLLLSSWKLNSVRIGVQVLLLHDCADVFLESAKMANYAKMENLSTGIFILFTMVWIVTRLYIFPINIILANFYGISDKFSEALAYVIFGLLVGLFCLHLFWTYFICKVAVAAVKSGPSKQKDARSSTEESSSSESEEATPIPPKMLEKRSRVLNENSKSLSFSGSMILSKIDYSQRRIIRRISAEIM